MYDFDKIIDRRGSGCFKYDALKPLYGREDLLSLWVADMDFEVAPCILEALAQRLAHGVFGYNFRLPEYYEAIRNWVKRRYHWETSNDWIVSTPGVVPAISLAVLSLTQPGDRVLIQTPVYRPFFNAVTDHDRCLLTNSLIYEKNRYTLDFDDFERKIKQASLFILCSPHNPVGKVWSRHELDYMTELSFRHGVPVVSDEIHADIVFPGFEFVSAGALEKNVEGVIVCVSPAKSFNIAGLSSASIIIRNPRLRKKISDLNEHLHLYLGNTFGVEAVKAAYNCGEEWLEALLSYLTGNRQYLLDYFERELPMLTMVPPEGTYLAWIDFSELGMDDNALFDFLTNKAKIALDPGRKFGVDGSGFSRLNFGCRRAILEEAMGQLKQAIMEYSG
jgi:cystathionine beta-lyase